MSNDSWAKMGPGVEFDLIRRMAARWGDLVHQAGDDAAILDVAHGARLVASTDTSVEGVHFRRIHNIKVVVEAAIISEIGNGIAKDVDVPVDLGVLYDWQLRVDLGRVFRAHLRFLLR